ncbi:hypothetical protein P0136_09195 [Lentisphaerota bacterium ZTH]|nr:type II secretion system protein GspD [Lentisphaerota bacterium]WET05538.1 hypothetical protein P0136_09195 [Lentisphaerota bacterium ZTH]
MIKNIINIVTLMLILCSVNAGVEEEFKTEDKGPVISNIILNDASMQEVARLIGNATGIPVIVSQEAAAIKVNIFLKNARCLDILSSICRSYGMWYHKNPQNGIIHVQTLEELKNNLQFAGEDKVEVVQVMYPSAIDLGEALKQLFVDRVVWIKPDDDSGNPEEKIKDALKRMDLIGSRGYFDIASKQNIKDSGSGITIERPGNDNDENKDDDKGQVNYDDIAKLKKAEKSKLQNLSGSRLLNAVKKLAAESVLTRKHLSHEPGLVYIAALPESNSLMLRSADPQAVNQIKELINRLDKPAPQVLLEVKVLSVNLDDQNDRAIDFLFGGGSISGGFDNGLLTVNGGGQVISSPSSNLVPTGSGIDKSAAIFNLVTENFNMRLQMLRKEKRITRLASPNLLVADNEASNIFVGQEVTVMQKAQQRVIYTNSSSGAQNPNVYWEIEAPRRRIGMSILITPRIHADRTVTIRLLQEHSTLGGERRNTFSGNTGQKEASQTTQGAEASKSESMFFITQDIQMETLTTTVVAKDSNIVVIGGLIEEGVTKQTEKIPFLCEIPVLGELLFTRLEEVRQRSEIIILIRPFVLLAPGEGNEVSKNYLKRMSQHPSARWDIPSLGVAYKKDIGKPHHINPNDPWLLRMYDRIRNWSVDDITSPEVEDAACKYHQDKNRENAVEEVKAIQNREKVE